jgi:D-sedoheptulose 7-phosphate isomerase
VLELSRLAKQVADTLETEVTRAGDLVAACLLGGRKLLVCGNGGSAADAQHVVAELIRRMTLERRSLPAITLSTDPSVVTALGNECGFENVFARQVEGLGQRGDVLIAISTSGRSPNVIRAVAAAHRGELQTVALLGQKGDPALDRCTVTLHISSTNTHRVQEMHMAVLHAICDYVEQAIVGPP